MRPSSSEPPLHPARNNATPNRAPSSVTTTAVLSLDSRSIVSHDSRRETKGLGPMKKGAGRLLSKHRHITHNLGSECKRLITTAVVQTAGRCGRSRPVSKRLIYLKVS